MSQAASPATWRPTIPPVFTLAGICILAMLSFGIGAAGGVRGWDLAVLALALLTAVVCFVPMLVDQGRPPERRQILITLTAGVFFVFFALPPFHQYLLIEGYQRGSIRLWHYPPREIAAAQAMSLIGLVFMLAGFYVPIGRFLAGFLPKATHEWSPSAAIGVAAVMIPAGWAIYLGSQYGLIPRSAGSGALGAIAFWTLCGVALLSVTYLRYRSRMVLLALLIVVVPTMIFNFFTGSKRLFLTPPAMVAFSYILFERRVRKSWVIGGFVAIVVLFPVSQFYRSVVTQNRNLGALDILKNPGRAVNLISRFVDSAEAGEYLTAGLEQTGARIDGLAVLTTIVRDTPEKVPYQGGWTIGLGFVAYIPRILWPGKPGITIGEWVTDTYAVQSGASVANPTDMAPSWIGELYLNFGPLGVIAGMFLVGIVYRILQERLFSSEATIPLLLAAVIVTYFAARGPAGSLTKTFNSIILDTAPLVFLHVAVRFLMPAPRRAPGAPRPGGQLQPISKRL